MPRSQTAMVPKAAFIFLLAWLLYILKPRLNVSCFRTAITKSGRENFAVLTIVFLLQEDSDLAKLVGALAGTGDRMATFLYYVGIYFCNGPKIRERGILKF